VFQPRAVEVKKLVALRVRASRACSLQLLEGLDGNIEASGARRLDGGQSLLMVVNVHHEPSTKCIKMVTSRNLGVLTNNFHEFW
jgi:hypothetical protein